MENNAKSIKEILANDSYVIPRYQRNYAWGKAEISQLIKDIDEFFPNGNNGKSYYIGSLVCFKREDGSFELIDGQQRHTTITLINLVLKNWEEGIKETVSVSNIKFDSRKKIQNYIESLYEAKEDFQNKIDELNIQGTGNFKDAIETIQEELQSVDIQKFAQNFYNKVFLFRIEVPEDTDLNHYFEIMNSRGEQLEKHEIVKALLMGKITADNDSAKREEQEKFSKMWDACADMGSYVFFNFDKERREVLFTCEGELNADKFESIPIHKNDDEKDNTKDSEDNKDTLADIIENHNITNDFPKEEKFIKDKYRSIIDFPNFLLQVLKTQNDSVSLDDKKLLEQFNDTELNPKKFIFNLLKYRVLFDKYVIKQDLADVDESKQNWSCRKLNTDFETTIKTFNSENEDDEELVKLQIMLYYSDSTNTYNNWLQEILKFEDFSIENYTDKVWGMAKVKLQKDKLSYPSVTVFNLYLIDFLLWKLYATEMRGQDSLNEENSTDELSNIKTIIFNQKSLFNSYRFKQINSREHILSQEHARRYNINEDISNSIGNLCLISTSQNSSGNKENPIDKKKMFQNDNSSLKRLVMFENYENDKWETEQIEKHKTEIEELIKKYVSNK